jgi:hypothetical protein
MSKFKNVAAFAAVVFLVSAPAGAMTVLTRTVSTSYINSFTTSAQYTGNTSANITTQTAPTILLAQFDTRGRFQLTDIDITFTRSINAAFTFNNGSNNTRTGDLQFTFTDTFGAPGLNPGLTTTLGSTAIRLDLISGTTNVLNSTLSGGGSGAFTPSTFAPYAGTGTVGFTSALSNFISNFTIVGQGGQGNLNGTAAGAVTGEVQIVYSYIDTIPEPSNWAMLIAGFGLIGATARRRRALIA